MEYGPGLTMGQIFNLDKERIKHALDGELVYSEDEEGFIYRPAPKEECREFILGKFDNAVYQTLEAYKYMRAYENLLARSGVKFSLPDFLHEITLEERKHEDYQYEPFDGGE